MITAFADPHVVADLGGNESLAPFDDRDLRTGPAVLSTLDDAPRPLTNAPQCTNKEHPLEIPWH